MSGGIGEVMETKMIELRQVMGKAEIGTPNVQLQFRIFRTHRIEGNRAISLADWSEDYGWSMWVLVPTIVNDDDLIR